MNAMLAYMLSLYQHIPLPPEKLAIQLNEWLKMQQSWCSDSEFSARFPWRETGLPQSTFLQRQLTVRGHHFITGPRYLGGDIHRPFIDVVASDADMTHDIAKAILQEWTLLNPQSIRILLPAHSPCRGSTDQLIYAAPLNALSNADSKADLLFTAATKEDISWCVDTLNASYQQTLRVMPELNTHLFPADEDDLHGWLLSGALYLLIEGNMRVGLIACESASVAFLKGMKIAEEVILPRYRGRGLAAQAQRLLRRHLAQCQPDASLMTGTILPANLASIKTAERAGRTCILKYQFLTA